MPDVCELAAELRTDLERRRKNLKEGDLGISGLTGSATRSIQSFEPLLRRLLGTYLANFQIDYEELRNGPGKGKPLSKLTFGQVLGCFELVNSRLTRACRAGPTVPKLLVGRRLLTPSDLKALNRICELRKSFHKNDAKLADHLPELLDDIEALLDSPLFVLASAHA